MNLKVGDSLLLENRSTSLVSVIQRLRTGWLVKPHGSDATEVIEDSDLAIAYNQHQLRHFPCDLEAHSASLVRKLKSTFDAWPADCKRECLRRLAYVQALDRVKDEHSNLLDAANLISATIWEANRARWEQEERDAAIAERVTTRRRDGEACDDDPVMPKALKPPNSRTLTGWHKIWEQSGRSELALLPDYAGRGNRTPRYPVSLDDTKPDTYSLMEKFISDFHMGFLKRNLEVAYDLYKAECMNSDIPFVSSRTFRRFKKRRFSDYETCVRREGKKAAYLKFSVFETREIPDRPLEEVEIDHCLVDLILVDSNKRVIGRPWITVMIDRSTRCIVGIHVSFMSPSHLTIQRVLAHTMYEKDLSEFTNLQNEWPCYGLPEWLISDRGKEFLSRSFRTSCLLLNIYPVALPGRKPWLKGAVERIFATLHAQVFDLREGSTKAWNADTYNSAKRATTTLAEFKQILVEWIVDDYHQTPHPALKRKFGRETTPGEAWSTLNDRYGVRWAPDPQNAFRLTGELFDRKILPTGVSIKGCLYFDKAVLTRLLRMPDGHKKSWVFRRDRADLGRIWVLVDGEGWVEIPNIDGDIFQGASEQQFQLWKKQAKETSPQNEAITIGELRAAKKRVEQIQAAALTGKSRLKGAIRLAQFGYMGNVFSPVPGYEGGRTETALPANDLLPTDHGENQEHAVHQVAPEDSEHLGHIAKPPNDPLKFEDDVDLAAAELLREMRG